MVADHRLSRGDAGEMAHWLSYGAAKAAYALP
jgi:hypothetical protein